MQSLACVTSKTLFLLRAGRLPRDFDTVGNLSSLSQHSGDGTIFGLAQLDGVACSLFFYFARESVNHVDFRPHRGRGAGALAGNYHFQRSEFLAFLRKNTNDIDGAACAERT